VVVYRADYCESLSVDSFAAVTRITPRQMLMVAELKKAKVNGEYLNRVPKPLVIPMSTQGLSCGLNRLAILQNAVSN
jgi:hypothetical protein